MKRIAFVSLAMGVLFGCQGERPLSGPSALIQDAASGGANGFFFWLPPVVMQQAPATQTFSRQLSPVVRIERLALDGCTATLVRTFSGAEVQISNAHYQAIWNTDLDNLDPACTYRITVRVGSGDLGFADVDAMGSGRELRNVDTDEFIPLLDGRTLPITFFIGVGSQCAQDVVVDCGEGTARPGENTTIVTTSGRAGTFIPAGAVDEEVAITIESIDNRPCIRGLPSPNFEGDPGSDANSCYDFTATTADGERLGPFNSPVIVGICVEFGDLDEVSVDLLQIFRFDGEVIQALPNTPAPFLSCDPGFTPSFGARRPSVLALAARGLQNVAGPLALLAGPSRPLFARANMVAFDLGTGGSTEEFSRFTWALPSEVTIDFDLAPDRSPVKPGTMVNSLYSRVGVTFSRTNPDGLCAGTGVYANDHGAGGFNSGQNNITPCPEGIASDFSEEEYGAIVARFALPATQACIGVSPTGFRDGRDDSSGFLEALDANGAVLRRTESTPGQAQTICVGGSGIAAVRFAGAGAGFAIFDNLFVSRVPLID